MALKALCNALCLASMAASAGCALMRADLGPKGLPASSGEAQSGYTYIPIDPFPVQIVDGDSCKDPAYQQPKDLLDALPDNAVRMLVEQFDRSGNVTYGVSKLGAKYDSYRVTVDFINADTINVPVRIARYVKKANGELEMVDVLSPTPKGPAYVPESDSYDVTRLDPNAPPDAAPTGGQDFNIPVYVGVGLRVSANIYVVGGTAVISGIGVIGAEAEANKITGSLVVQTLGINGKSVSAALPIQSELNRNTAQNAIVAVGSIKALLYSNGTITSPRVVGMYLPFAGGKPVVNALISELSKKRVQWQRPCLLNTQSHTP